MLTSLDHDGIKSQKLDVTSDITSLLQSFESDPDGTLEQIYTTYRQSFMEFARTYSKDETLTIDCFQEAVISLYENLAIGRVTDQNTTVKTYLYAIGKYKLINAQRKKGVDLKINLHSIENVITDEAQDDNEHRQSIVDSAFEQLGQKCKEVLLKFYYHRYSIEAIMHAMSYKNENTVKAHKSRCLAKMKDIINNSKEI